MVGARSRGELRPFVVIDQVVVSPLAEQVADPAAMLDDADQGDAADAMYTCAVLFGYRPRK